MFVATILAFLSSPLWAHDLARDAAINSALSSLVPSSAVTNCDVARTDCSDEKFERVMSGFHGHLLFGQGPFYLSHLPLYSPPHNYQAIYEVEFPESSQDLKNRLKEKLAQGGYATFEPSQNPANPSQSSTSFKIPQFTCLARSAGDQIFWGEVHDGHFERGGIRLGNAGLIIKRVIYYQELSLAPLPPHEGSPSAPADYIVFGERNNFYAARVLGDRPSVDQILSLHPSQNDHWRRTVGGLDHVRFASSAATQSGRVLRNQDQIIKIQVNPLYTEVRELR